MIQRVQSIYLLISTFISFGFYVYTLDTNEKSLLLDYHLFFITGILSLICLFLFKKRNYQALICLFLFIVYVFIISYCIYSYYESFYLEFSKYSSIAGFIQLLLLYLARKAINKDESLVRSIDRIR